MKKHTIIVFFGGASSEYSVSLESAYSVLQGMDQTQYRLIPVGITQTGEWFYFSGAIEKIKTDTWQNEADCRPVFLATTPKEPAIWVQDEKGLSKILVDAALPVLHGKNGEDGSIQGLLQMAGIPVIGCGILASALCMDKDRAHKLVALTGIRVPQAIVLKKEHINQASRWAEQNGYPLYVKPVKAGSSYGITKVQNEEELEPAMQKALVYDDEIMLEENIEGFEVGCAVLGSGESLLTEEIDEIELSGGFFDFTEKYTLATSSIHVPARISAVMAEKVKEAACKIYQTLACSGFARVDMFITPGGEIVFNEVNTIPGFTEHSRYPSMMKAAGFSFEEILRRMLEEGLRR